jgi:putative Ca2+/H+ antiporter (TMEM165/GDT1 family)
MKIGIYTIILGCIFTFSFSNSQIIRYIENSQNKNSTSLSDIFPSQLNQTTFDIWNYKEKFDMNISILNSFFWAFIIVFVSEIADKTFIIILIFSTRRKQIKTFFAAVVAILFMNYLSIFFGFSIDFLLYENVINWSALIILIIYGLSNFLEAMEMSTKKVEDRYINMMEDEIKQRKRELKSTMSRINRGSPQIASMNVIEEANDDLENSSLTEPILSRKEDELSIATPIFSNPEDESNAQFLWLLMTSIMAAECGDRSQINTIIISSVFNRYGVIFGSSLALIICVYLNVYFGHKIANYLSEKQVATVCSLLLISCGGELLLFKLNIL